ncbi:hypothetical protein GCM10007175_08970 [Pseudarthrobacter scleromae]|uniref:Uncharacterized protein n=1 Tax=Pseudarthrobacter scleromae TaxID=158897 RepID=A0ABQ2CBW8_9MICC|nr:hypothetical protein GCM10007175_08970 [Pseudarthrobacter scleromae]
MKVPSGFFTSIFKAPGRVPSSGGTDCAIQVSGSSKITVLAGSEKVFHAEAVAAGWAVAEPDAAGVAPGDAAADADPSGGAVAVAAAPESPGSAVHSGPLFDGVEQPARSAPARSTAVPSRTPADAMRLMQPA